MEHEIPFTERATPDEVAIPVDITLKIKIDDWAAAKGLKPEDAYGDLVTHFAGHMRHELAGCLQNGAAEFIRAGGDVGLHIPTRGELEHISLAVMTVKIIELRVFWLARNAWKEAGDLDRLAIEMSLLLRLLFQAGYDVAPYVDQWQASYRNSVRDGKKWSYREVWNEGDVENLA